MRLYEAPKAPGSVGYQVDWSRPIIVFDDWPFQDSSVPLARGTLYLDSEGAWSEPISVCWSLDRSDYVLGYTTGGDLFVASIQGLETQR